MSFPANEIAIIESINDGDTLRNYSSYLFLKQFIGLQPITYSKPTKKNKKLVTSRLARLNHLFDLLEDNCTSYQSNFAYGDLYSDFLLALENAIEVTGRKDIMKLYPFVEKVYLNENLALEVSAHSVRRATAGLNSGDDLFKQTEKVISSFMDRGAKLNKVTPQSTGSIFRRLLSIIWPSFKPQLVTSMPSIRNYKYKEEGDHPKELRIGTQAQVHKGKARVSPTFKLWLEMKAATAANQEERSPIHHVYFNVLGLDHSGMEGNRERGMSKALHKIEEEGIDVAVITLPADKGDLDYSMLRKNKPTVDTQAAKQRMLAIALEEASGIKDFKISRQTRDLLFGQNKQTEKKQLESLINQSFETLGFKDAKYISPADQQAIFFHFVKFELTKYIIDTLGPTTINFSCKDGIDRGGVASAYYNLVRSIESGKPLSKQEFNQALHAAPALVKGRGMNANIARLWNAIDGYIEGQKGKQHLPLWLEQWREDHAPKYSRLGLINRLNEYMHKRGGELYSERLLMQSVHGFTTEANTKAQYNSLFGTFKADEKIKVAEKLRKKLEQLTRGEEINANDFTAREKEVLNNGRLRAIFQDLKNNGPWSDSERVTIRRQSEDDEGRSAHV